MSDSKKKSAASTSNNRFKKTFAKWFWILFAVGVIAVACLFYMINKGWLGYLPPLDELQNPRNKYATELYSSDLQVIGRYYISENRVEVKYADISENVINALISTEDVRFYDHCGVDFKALFRTLMKLGRAGGGSTLTQQLSKQLYSPHANNIFERAMQKPIEWVISVQLERLYSKEEIIQMYLNQFDFLYNAVGIKSAAQVYFNTTPDKLNVEQSAMLVGMFKNPALYNPIRRPEKTQARRNVVLSQMVKNDVLTEQEYDSLKVLPLGINFHSVDHKEGTAPYFREYLRQMLTAKEPKESNYPSWNKQQFAIDTALWNNNPLYGFCNKNKKSDGTPYNLYNDGLRIYTTIDSRMQKYAEEAVSEHMQYLQGQFFKEKQKSSTAPFSRQLKQSEVNDIMTRSMRQTDRYRSLKKAGMTEEQIVENFNTPVEMRVFSYDGLIDTVMSPLDSIRWQKYFLRCGFMSMDPKSGHVKAYVGGPNFAHFQYDMVNIGRRQVGSTVKPYLYTLAMEENMWPCDKTVNQQITLQDANGRDWTPRNSDKDHIGDTVTLQWGLTTSNNWISAYLMSLFTPDALVRLMRSFGIQGDIPAVVSLCLGPCEVSVAEMVDAYTTFPNKGIRIEPLYVTRIEDNNGNIIATFTPRTHEIISEEASYKMITMLRSVIDHGTGVRVRYKYGLRMPMGGKTGTTQNNSDGWFMGFTPSLVNGVWVGGEDRGIHFDRMAEGQGASMALPIWALYMKKVLADPTLGYSETEDFDIPEWFDPEEGCK